MSIDRNDNLRIIAPKPTRDTDIVGCTRCPYATKEDILDQFRYEWMETTDATTGIKWRLEGGVTNNDWVELEFGGGGGGEYVNITGDTMTGNLWIENTGPVLGLRDTDGNDEFRMAMFPYDAMFQSSKVNFIFTGINGESVPGEVYIKKDDGTHSFYHSGNDGPGSGLDADLLDGKDSTAFSLVGHEHLVEDITDFPSTMPPSSHDHPISEITNLQTELDSKEDYLEVPANDGYVLSSTAAGVRSWIDIQSTVPEITYSNPEPTPEDHGGIPAGSTFTDVTLQQMWTDQLYPYQVPAFSDFNILEITESSVEVGSVIISADYTFNWSTTNDENIKTDSVVIRDHTADVDLGTGLANDGTELLNMPTAISYAAPATHTWRVQATNSKDAVFSKDFSVSWRWKTFWGNDADGTITAADILAGSSRLDADGVGEYHPPQATPGEYKWLAYSTDYAMASKIYDKGSGADVVMDPGYNPATIEITNAQGVVVEMYVYRTLNATEADLTMVVEGATKEAQDNNEPRDPIPGTLPISGMVAPLDAADQYPVTDDQFNKGGYRTVATMADMDPGIDPLKRKPGMMVYVQENGNKYILDDDLTTWVIDGGGVPVGGATWDVLRKSSTADFATEWAESPGAFIQDIAWADLVAMQVAGNIRQWDKYRITDQSNRLIEIKLQSPDGSSWFEVINDEGTVTLLKVE